MSSSSTSSSLKTVPSSPDNSVCLPCEQFDYFGNTLSDDDDQEEQATAEEDGNQEHLPNRGGKSTPVIFFYNFTSTENSTCSK
jgi:hypothetical protein